MNRGMFIFFGAFLIAVFGPTTSFASPYSAEDRCQRECSKINGANYTVADAQANSLSCYCSTNDVNKNQCVEITDVQKNIMHFTKNFSNTKCAPFHEQALARNNAIQQKKDATVAKTSQDIATKDKQKIEAQQKKTASNNSAWYAQLESAQKSCNVEKLKSIRSDLDSQPGLDNQSKANHRVEIQNMIKTCEMKASQDERVAKCANGRNPDSPYCSEQRARQVDINKSHSDQTSELAGKKTKYAEIANPTAPVSAEQQELIKKSKEKDYKVAYRSWEDGKIDELKKIKEEKQALVKKGGALTPAEQKRLDELYVKESELSAKISKEHQKFEDNQNARTAARKAPSPQEEAAKVADKSLGEKNQKLASKREELESAKKDKEALSGRSTPDLDKRIASLEKEVGTLETDHKKAIETQQRINKGDESAINAALGKSPPTSERKAENDATIKRSAETTGKIEQSDSGVPFARHDDKIIYDAQGNPQMDSEAYLKMNPEQKANAEAKLKEYTDAKEAEKNAKADNEKLAGQEAADTTKNEKTKVAGGAPSAGDGSDEEQAFNPDQAAEQRMAIGGGAGAAGQTFEKDRWDKISIGSNDPCDIGQLNKAAKDFEAQGFPGGKSRMAFTKFFNQNKGSYDSTNTCKSAKTELEVYGVTSQVAQAGAQVSAGVAGGIATSEVQEVASKSSNPNQVVRQGYRSMADALRATAISNIAVGGVHMLTAGMETKVAVQQSNHADDATEHNAGVESQIVQGDKFYGAEKKDQRKKLTTSGLVQMVTQDSNEEVLIKEANETGSARLSNAQALHDELSSQATSQAVQNFMLAANSAASAITNFMMADQYDEFASMITDQASMPTSQMAPGDTPQAVTDQSGMPVFGGGGGGSEDGEVVAENNATDSGPAPFIPPGSDGGRGGSGGLKDRGPGVGNSPAITAGTTTNGAGAGGGGLSGLGGGSGSDGGEKGESLAAGDRSNYSGSGGGGGFNSALGGARRSNDTGSFDMNALLASLLPKKDDKAQGSNILDKGGRKPGSADEDDGSILGPNSNLWHRVAKVYSDSYKAGRVK